MPTAVIKSVGSSGRDYATLALWEADLPGNLITGDTTQTAEVYNDSEFLNQSLVVSGINTDITHWIRIKCAAGESFTDNPSAADNNLRYDISNGVGFRYNSSSPFTAMFTISNKYSYIEGLQSFTSSDSFEGRHVVITGIADNSGLENHLVDSDSSVIAINLTDPTTSAINCLVILRQPFATGAVGFQISGNAALKHCTVVAPTDITSSAKGFVGSSHTGVVESCSALVGGVSFTGILGNYNASSDGTAPGANSIQNLITADQFENTLSASIDLRLKGGSDLEGAGTPAGALDIIGTIRDLTAPDIGCWEYVVSIILNGTSEDLVRAQLLVTVGDPSTNNDLWHSYLKGQVGHDGHVDDLHNEWLGSLGLSQKTLKDRISARLASLGYSGAVDSMWAVAWKNGDYIV